MRKFETQFQTYTESGIVESNCADITFVNSGTDDVIINGSLTLTTDASISIQAEAWEMNTTKFNVVFSTSVAPSLLVIRKHYV